MAVRKLCYYNKEKKTPIEKPKLQERPKKHIMLEDPSITN